MDCRPLNSWKCVRLSPSEESDWLRMMLCQQEMILLFGRVGIMVLLGINSSRINKSTISSPFAFCTEFPNSYLTKTSCAFFPHCYILHVNVPSWWRGHLVATPRGFCKIHSGGSEKRDEKVHIPFRRCLETTRRHTAASWVVTAPYLAISVK